MQNKNIKKLTLGGVLAALTILSTTLLAFPIPGGLGYIHLGDAAILLCAIALDAPFGILCGAAASAVSDLLLGYTLYMPATLIIKGSMAALFLLLYRILPRKLQGMSYYLSSLMVPIGYFLYESVLYSVESAIPNIGLNLLQGLVGAFIAHIMHRVLIRLHVIEKL